jgi:uncharacterized delta-60 repeat protein
MLSLAGVMLSMAALVNTPAAPGDVDALFDPGSSLDGPVSAVTVLRDGKVLIAGSFTTVHGVIRRGIARLNPDGSTDRKFLDGLSGPSGWASVSMQVVQPDSKIIIGGGFSSFNGSPRHLLARLNPDGSLDESFTAGIDSGEPHSLALQSDGKILVGGLFEMVNGVARTNLVRLNPDGSLDNSFSASVEAEDDPMVAAIAVQEDGKIVIGGSFSLVDGIPVNGITRLNPDGSLDMSFPASTGDPGDMVRAIALQNDGRILIGGTFEVVNTTSCPGIARLNADGTLDDSFSASVDEWGNGVQTIVPQEDGRVVLGGDFQVVDGVGRPNLARLNQDGTLDTTFLDRLAGPDGAVWCAALQDDGAVLIGAGFSSVNEVKCHYVARLLPDGSFDDSFGNGPSGPDGYVMVTTVQNDGIILIGGGFYTVNGIAASCLARLDSDGSLDTSFSSDAEAVNQLVFCIGRQDDGKLLVGGWGGLARLNPDGSRDPDYSGSIGAIWPFDWPYVYTLALQPDGKLLIGGTFDFVNGASRPCLARLNPDGSLDSSFLNGIEGPNHFVYSIALQNDGKILIYGAFSMVNGVLCQPLVRLEPDGSLDDAFSMDPQWWYQPTALTLQSDGKILIGEYAYDSEGNPSFGLVRLNSDGSSDVSFQNNQQDADDIIKSVLVQNDGKILIGGYFTVINGVPRGHLARLNPDGSLDKDFLDGQTGANSSVLSIETQPDGKILVGGMFTSFNDSACSYVTRLIGDYVPLTVQSSPVSQTAELGSTVDFHVTAAGYPAPSFQWYFNGTNLLNCTNTDLELDNVQFLQSGTYTVVVSNVCGRVTSSPATLSVIPPVDRRPVPALNLIGDAGSSLNLEFSDTPGRSANWSPLASVSLTPPPQFCFDLSLPLPPQRFYRAWQTGTPAIRPSLSLNFVPAITLTGNIGEVLRLNYINQIGPTDAWVNLATVTLTNTSQLYFDVSAIGQPARLYRIVPTP